MLAVVIRLKNFCEAKSAFATYNGNVRLKKFYFKDRNFPKHLSKGLYRLGVLDTFMEIVRQEKPKLYKKWYESIKQYISEKQKEYDQEKLLKKC